MIEPSYSLLRIRVATLEQELRRVTATLEAEIDRYKQQAIQDFDTIEALTTQITRQGDALATRRRHGTT